MNTRRRSSHCSQSRASDDAADRPLNVRYDRKLAKYHRLVDQNGFRFVHAVFSHTGKIHESIKRLITEQIHHKLILSEGNAKQSRVKSTMRWWTKCASMMIAETASRNIAAKAGKMSEAVLDAQASFATTEATGQEASSERVA